MRTRHRALCLFSTLAVPCSLLPGLKTSFDHNNLFVLHLNYSILKGRFKKLTTVSREEGVRSGAHSATRTPPRTAGEAPARRQLPANYPPPGHRSGAEEDSAQRGWGGAATRPPHAACPGRTCSNVITSLRMRKCAGAERRASKALFLSPQGAAATGRDRACRESQINLLSHSVA